MLLALISLFILPIGYISITGRLSPTSNNMEPSFDANLQLILYYICG